MKAVASLAGETARLEALAAYDILDTAPEPPFDELVQLAASLVQSPIATLTLIDADRQWFKARVGLALSETPRAIAFCDHTIREDGPLVIPDTHADPRFRNNPLVTGTPHLRFYAGVPLRTPEAKAIGTLAVMDVAPRALDAGQAAGLAMLARQAESQLELRLALRALNDAKRDLETFRDAVGSELRAPLRALSASLAGLSETLQDGQPRSQAYEAAERAAELSAMVESLHELARHADLRPARRAIDMRSLAERAVSIVDKTYAGASARILVAPMPQALGSEPLVLSIWLSVIASVLARARTGSSIVEVSAAREGELVRYFVREASGSAPGLGTSLGIARRILERLGGSLSRGTQAGQGIAVSFTLPPA